MSQSKLNMNLIMLESKREILFKRINRLYEMSKNITTFDSRNNEHFITESETIDKFRDEYMNIVDQIVEINLTLKPGSVPDYQFLESFDDLYIRVKRIRNKICETSIRTSDNTISAAKFSIKLPPIELPSFDGRMENWPAFYESFKTNIHHNDQLSDSQRVQYLMGKLSHSALKITAGIVPTGDTYQIIWNSLVKKFQDKRSLGTHYLNNILELKNCSPTANNLNLFIEMYSASLSALKQLDIPDLTDFILLHCALRKIDSKTAHTFELSVRNQEIPSSKDFINFVQDQVKIL